jgi:hypothetical protein
MYAYMGTANTYLFVSVATYSDWDTYSGTSQAAEELLRSDYVQTYVYFRIRRTGTTYGFEASTDGLNWTRWYSGTIPFTPTHFGPIHGRANQLNATRFHFFRYVASDVGLYGLARGRRIREFA